MLPVFSTATTPSTSTHGREGQSPFMGGAVLNGTVWAIELTPMAGNTRSLRTMHDTLRFEEWQVASKRLEAEGYAPTEFTAGQNEQGVIVWEAMQVRRDRGVALWRGQNDGNSIRGTLSQYSLDGLEGEAREFSFVGRSGNAPRAASGFSDLLGRASRRDGAVPETPPVQAPSLAVERMPQTELRSDWHDTLNLLEERIRAAEDVDSKLLEYQNRIKELEASNRQLNERLVRQQRSIADYEDKLRQMDRDMNAGKTVYLSKQAAFTTLNAQLELKDSEIAGLKMAYQELEQEYLAGKDTIERLERDRRELQRMQKNYAELREEVSSLRSVRDGSRRRMDELNAQLHTANLNSERLRAELEQATKKLGEQSKQIQWLENKVAEVAPQHENAQQQLLYLNDAHEAEIVKHKETAAELSALKIAFQDMRNELLVANAKLINAEDELQKRNLDLRRSETAREQLAAEAGQLKEGLRKKDFDFQEVFTQSEQAVMQARLEAERRGSRAESLAKELEETKALAGRQQQELVLLQQRLDKASADFNAERSKLIDERNAAKEDFERQLDFLQDNLRTMQNALRSEKEASNVLKLEMANIRRTYADEKLLRQENIQALESLNTEVTRLDQDKSALAQANAQLEQLLEGSRRHEAALQKQIKDLKQTVAELEANYEKARNDSAGEQLKVATAELRTVQQQLLNQRKAYTALEQNLQREQSERARSEGQLAKQIREAQEQLDAYKTSNQKLTAALSERTRAGRTADETLDKVKAQAETRQKELARLQQQYSKALEQIDRLKSENQGLAQQVQHRDEASSKQQDVIVLQLQKRLQSVEQENTKLLSRIQTHKYSSEDLLHLRKEQDRLLARIDQLEKDNAALANRAQEGQKGLVDAERRKLLERVAELETLIEKREVALSRARQREQELVKEMELIRLKLR